MIYCVIPPELEHELFDRLRDYYRDNPGVEVIIDRRSGGDADRRQFRTAAPDERRVLRNRRRPRAPGTFPPTNGFDL